MSKEGGEKGTLDGEAQLVAALEEEYEVERVLGKRMVWGKPEYLSKWKGYPASHAPRSTCIATSLWKDLKHNEVKLRRKRKR